MLLGNSHVRMEAKRRALDEASALGKSYLFVLG